MNAKNEVNFFMQYYPAILLIFISSMILTSFILDIGFNIRPEIGKIMPILIIPLAIYRWIVSRWLPRINYFNSTEDYHRLMSTRSQNDMPLAITEPGFFGKALDFVANKIFGVLIFIIIWAPMEFFIQVKFIITASIRWNTEDKIMGRRGLWPNEAQEIEQ